jgi:serine/threonine protein kinase
VLLYCALSAKLPFGISLQLLPSSMEECREAFTLTFPDQPWAGISRECKDLISKLLEIDPIKRLTAHEAVHHAWVSSTCMHMLLLLSFFSSCCCCCCCGSAITMVQFATCCCLCSSL